MAQVIIPLDVPTLDDAMGLVDSLGEAADFYKVGLELFTAEGSAAVQALKQRNKRVFLDLKLHDIPLSENRLWSPDTSPVAHCVANPAAACSRSCPRPTWGAPTPRATASVAGTNTRA